jgi:thiamine biosynthesis lipoprotein
MHRRDFLDPKHLAQSVGQVIGAASLLTDNEEPQQGDVEINLLRYAHRAMATVFEVVLPFGHSVSTGVIHEALELIDQLESQLTVYRESSEVSELNRKAACEEVIVESKLFDLLQLSQTLSQATNGAFDITSGALVKAWGFFKEPKRVPNEQERAEALAASGWQNLQLDSSRKSVCYRASGLQLNLGSIGKGYALDRIAEFFKNQCEGPTVLLHGGKSSVLGQGAPPGQRSWLVALEHPWKLGTKLATLSLYDRAMATSASTYKHLVYQGKKLSHILDPRTGWPAKGIASATAIAPTAAEADALATAFFVMGLEQTEAFCRSHPQFGAILLAEGSSRPQTFNLLPQECQLLG